MGEFTLPKKSASLQRSASRATANTLPVLAVLFGVWALPAQAAQNSGAFNVTINLNGGGAASAPVGSAPPSVQASVLCRSGTMVGTFGSAVTVVCATGVTGTSAGTPTGAANLPWTSMPDNTYRFMFSTYRDGEQYRTVDYTGAGTVASWRTIKLNDRDYLEMMLHW